MKKTLFIIVLLFSASGLMAQQNLSLMDAIKIGLENNYQVKIFQKDYEIAERNDAWGTAGRWPIINIGITNVNRYDDREPTLTTEREKYWTNQVAPFLAMNWTLFDGFSIGLTKENFEHLKNLSRGSEIDVVESTIQDIILAYYQVLLENEKLEVLQEVMDLSRDRYEVALMKQDLGNAVTFEVLQEKNSYLRDSTNYIGQEIFYKNAIRDLNFLLGQAPSADPVLTDPFEMDMPDYRFEELKRKMLEMNRGLRNMQISQAMLENDVEIARSNWYPSLSLNAGIDYQKGWLNPVDYDVQDYYNYDTYANLTLSFNIFNGGNTERAIENAKVEREIGILRIEELRLTLTNNLKNLFELYELRKQRYEVSLENKESARLQLDIAADKFASGAINSFDYRGIQLIYINAAIDELQSMYDLIDTQARLLKLTGGIISEMGIKR